MSYAKTARAGRPWTKTEDNVLRRAYPNKTYSEIAALRAFNGKRSVKAIRRRMERSVFGY
jgi:hypothetical protein